MKKSVKVIIIVLAVLIGILIVDTIQAKLFNNKPILKIVEYYNGGNIYQKDKSILVDTITCTNGDKHTIFKWEKYSCPIDNIYNSKTPNNTDDKVKKITWEEITEDGVNEELLLKNIDEELLTEIATELQTLVNEAKEEEIENPEIVITEGWARVWEYERYKKVLNMGTPAMKPLYLIIYKSPNAGEYEYLCARILYELSGFDFYWTNSKDFLESFNQKILESR